jgi:heat shock protein HslJ
MDRAEARLSGSAGCNTYFAGYQVTGNQLAITPPASTRRLCTPQAIMDQEAQYLLALDSTQRFEIAGARLRLFGLGDRTLTYTVGAAAAAGETGATAASAEGVGPE